MPNRIGGLYAQATSLDALHAAYLRARVGKRCRRDVDAFERDLGANLVDMARALDDGDYRPGGYACFGVQHPKPRVIFAPRFRDTVVQHALYAALSPVFERVFIHDSYGARIGKGHHRAADRAQHFLRASTPGSYFLQLDIRKFFYRIDRDVLRFQLARRLKEPRLIDLSLSLCDHGQPEGLPIGALLSQLFAAVYLHDLDDFVKRELRVRRYVRFVDDFVLFGLSREEGHAQLVRIREFLSSRLRLELSRYTLAPIRRGLNFVGFRAWRSTRVLRKHSLYRFSRSLRRGDVPSLVSILGNAQRTASYRHLAGRLAAERPDLLPALPAPVATRVEIANA